MELIRFFRWCFCHQRRILRWLNFARFLLTWSTRSYNDRRSIRFRLIVSLGLDLADRCHSVWFKVERWNISALRKKFDLWKHNRRSFRRREKVTNRIALSANWDWLGITYDLTQFIFRLLLACFEALVLTWHVVLFFFLVFVDVDYLHLVLGFIHLNN